MPPRPRARSPHPPTLAQSRGCPTSRPSRSCISSGSWTSGPRSRLSSRRGCSSGRVSSRRGCGRGSPSGDRHLRCYRPERLRVRAWRSGMRRPRDSDRTLSLCALRPCPRGGTASRRHCRTPCWCAAGRARTARPCARGAGICCSCCGMAPRRAGRGCRSPWGACGVPAPRARARASRLDCRRGFLPLPLGQRLTLVSRTF
mmetsp:Transcript_16757/g.41916  ORF Transcript_16757/g.41916 Transcript_16757/m.41916 type:complete len:201 (+) Transcript_16757:209-811(+)